MYHDLLNKQPQQFRRQFRNVCVPLCFIKKAVRPAHRFPQKEADIQRLRETVSGTDGFLDKAKRYMDITELTPELLRLFIEKIVVHEKEVKWSKHAPQTVEIYYNGIGFIDKQHQDMESLQPLKTEEPRQAS